MYLDWEFLCGYWYLKICAKLKDARWKILILHICVCTKGRVMTLVMKAILVSCSSLGRGINVTLCSSAELWGRGVLFEIWMSLTKRQCNSSPAQRHQPICLLLIERVKSQIPSRNREIRLFPLLLINLNFVFENLRHAHSTGSRYPLWECFRQHTNSFFRNYQPNMCSR
jgi:hypothetical protein